MTKGRLEAFSDEVLALVITIMVLELKPSHGDGFVLWMSAFAYYLLAHRLQNLHGKDSSFTKSLETTLKENYQ